ncbi:MAG: hypothetical protein LBJ77_00555 [Holosporales bacterium]|jgi:hypothetical protein|nr:hypothetical protein [Holosporales bacterium]
MLTKVSAFALILAAALSFNVQATEDGDTAKPVGSTEAKDEVDPEVKAAAEAKRKADEEAAADEGSKKKDEEGN